MSRVHKDDISDLIESTSNRLDLFSGDILQLFHHIQLQFGLTPRQYLNWGGKICPAGEVHEAKMSPL
jgi:hypothetical protein